MYQHGNDTVSVARQALTRYFDFYNRRLPHSALDGETPDMAYFNLSTPRSPGWLNPGRNITYKKRNSVQLREATSGQRLGHRLSPV